MGPPGSTAGGGFSVSGAGAIEGRHAGTIAAAGATLSLWQSTSPPPSKKTSIDRCPAH
jgi:hypothetical protein